MTRSSSSTGNDTYLFVGGRGDGERIHVPFPDVLYSLRFFPKPSFALSAEEVAFPAAPVEDDKEVYRMRKIAVGEQMILYYDHVTLSDEDCIRLLLSHYRP
jgi:hypothetical protein